MMTNDEIRSLAPRAREILENPAFRAALKEIHDQEMSKLLNKGLNVVENTSALQESVLYIRAVNTLLTRIAGYVQSAELLDKQGK